MSFEVFAVMNVQIVVLCVVTQCSQRILMLLCPWRWRWYFPPKSWYLPTRQHGFNTCTTAISYWNILLNLFLRL